MSESSARRVSIRLSAEGAEQVRQQLVATGEAGDRAMKQIASASSTTGEATTALSGRIGALSEAIRGVAPAASGVLDVLASVAAGAESLASRAGSLDGAMSGLAGRFASFATVVIGVPALLQSIGLGINSAGQAAVSATTQTASYDAVMKQLNETLLTTEQRARNAANALSRAQGTGLALNSEVSLGQLFERRSTAQTALEGTGPNLANAEQALARARERAVRGSPAAESALAPLQATVDRIRAQQAALQSDIAELTRQERDLAAARARGLSQSQAADLGLGPINMPDPKGGKPVASGVQSRPGGGGRTADQADLADVTRDVQAANREYDRLQFEIRNVGTETGIVTGMTQDLAGSVSRAGAGYEQFFGNAASAFEDMITKGRSARDVINALASDLAKLIIRQTVTNPLASAVSGLVSSVGSSIGNYFAGSNLSVDTTPKSGAAPRSIAIPASAPARAMGGPVDPGGAYLVGEDRPEIFVPRGAGTILPNAGGIRQTINIDARGAEAGTDAKIRAAVAVAVRQSNAELLAAISRGGQVAKQVGRR